MKPPALLVLAIVVVVVVSPSISASLRAKVHSVYKRAAEEVPAAIQRSPSLHDVKKAMSSSLKTEGRYRRHVSLVDVKVPDEPELSRVKRVKRDDGEKELDRVKRMKRAIDKIRSFGADKSILRRELDPEEEKELHRVKRMKRHTVDKAQLHRVKRSTRIVDKNKKRSDTRRKGHHGGPLIGLHRTKRVKREKEPVKKLSTALRKTASMKSSVHADTGLHQRRNELDLQKKDQLNPGTKSHPHKNKDTDVTLKKHRPVAMEKKSRNLRKGVKDKKVRSDNEEPLKGSKTDHFAQLKQPMHIGKSKGLAAQHMHKKKMTFHARSGKAPLNHHLIDKQHRSTRKHGRTESKRDHAFGGLSRDIMKLQNMKKSLSHDLGKDLKRLNHFDLHDRGRKRVKRIKHKAR